MENKYLEQMLDCITPTPDCSCRVMFLTELEYCGKVAL